MGAFLEFVMRGPVQAIVVAMMATAMPLMSWLGGAVVALITLSQGVTSGAKVFVCAMLPALYWWVSAGDPGAAWILILSMVLSEVLRRTVSWDKTLTIGAVWALIMGSLIPVLMPEFVAELVELTGKLYSKFNPEVITQLGDDFQSYFSALWVGSLATSYFGFALVSVMLGRSWQARLYNPGGFQKEFHELRLSPWVASILFLVMIAAGLYSSDLLMIVMVASIPLIIAGLALFHGTIAKRKMNSQWIVVFYMILVFFGSGLCVLLILLAVADSWLNLRNYIKPVE